MRRKLAQGSWTPQTNGYRLLTLHYRGRGLAMWPTSPHPLTGTSPEEAEATALRTAEWWGGQNGFDGVKIVDAPWRDERWRRYSVHFFGHDGTHTFSFAATLANARRMGAGRLRAGVARYEVHRGAHPSDPPLLSAHARRPP